MALLGGSVSQWLHILNANGAKMGADIHFVMEFKPKDTETWIGIYSDLYTPQLPNTISKDTMFSNPNHVYSLVGRRNYEFFAALAGVRGEGPEPLGIPEDASDLTRYNIRQWEPDGHSHSYLSAHEFCRLADEHYLQSALYTKTITYRLQGGTEKAYFPLLLLDLYPELELSEGEYRVVFWFDN